MKELENLLGQLKARAPLTLTITNLVTMGDCANALLAIGAAPVMSNDPGDARDLAALASAVVLNIGTVGAPQMEILLAAGLSARDQGRPVVLDPVGAGATATRRAAAEKLLPLAGIIRGNWSEIQSLAGLGGIQRGVDSASGDDLSAVAGLAGELAGRLGAVVAVTGATDVVAAQGRTWLVEGGSPLLTRLTGTGCLLSALTGAYAGAADGDLARAALGALAHLALAGERAAAALPGSGPALGTFKVNLFDQLALLSPADLGREARITEK
jgi:hydroxyethylthiazole kinase